MTYIDPVGNAFNGGSSDTEVYLNDGNDVYTGATGIAGSQPYVVVYGGEGNDTMTYSGSGAVYFYGDGGNDTITGGSVLIQRDSLYGGDGNDILNAMAGSDYIEGGFGDDDCYGGSGFDQIYGGFGDDELFGEADQDYLYGGAGSDALRGGAGDDVMRGDDGNDAYEVTEINDHVIEGFGNGFDTVYSSVTYTLPADVEELRLFSTDIINGTGNELANNIVGNIAANVLSGMAGNDAIFGDAGSDVLIGGLGRDTLSGDADADRFDFNSPKESVKGANCDQILDFSHAEGDRIDLSGIDAKKGHGNQAFKFIGAHGFGHHAGELHFVRHGGQFVTVEGDINGDGKADFQIDVHNLSNTLNSLAQGDFVL